MFTWSGIYYILVALRIGNEIELYLIKLKDNFTKQRIACLHVRIKVMLYLLANGKANAFVSILSFV